MLSRISAQLDYWITARYGIWTTAITCPSVVWLIGGEEVLIAKYSDSGMPLVGLTDLLHLPNIGRVGDDKREKVHLTDSMRHDLLEMLLLRCGHVSKSKLLEGHRHMLYQLFSA